MNRLVDRMSEKELVRRGADPEDRRRVMVELGKEGERLSPLVHFYHEINAVLLAGFSQEEEKAFVSFLERAEKNLRNALGEAS
jgi:DNA-binding MarR family transcriptional regulator